MEANTEKNIAILCVGDCIQTVFEHNNYNKCGIAAELAGKAIGYPTVKQGLRIFTISRLITSGFELVGMVIKYFWKTPVQHGGIRPLKIALRLSAASIALPISIIGTISETVLDANGYSSVATVVGFSATTAAACISGGGSYVLTCFPILVWYLKRNYAS